METPGTISFLINSLSNDEDIRQDLWVHYLSGYSADSFVSHLEKLSLEYSQEEQAEDMLTSVLASERFSALLDRLSEFERTIVWLLMLGLSVVEIAVHKNISEVRIRQSVDAIRYNRVWEELYDIKGD